MDSLSLFFSFEGARPEKGIKSWPFFKNPSEINSTHPFYPILIPNIPYVKFLYLKIISAKIYRKIFLLKQKK